MAREPIESKIKAISGRKMTDRSCSIGVISNEIGIASAVFSVRVSPRTMTSKPSICSNKSSRSTAIKSMMPNSKASLALAALALIIASLAHSTALSPRRSARFLISATKIFSTLACKVSSMSPPCISTGLAAPMLVCGAIAAACPARVINVPAEAAKPPEG